MLAPSVAHDLPEPGPHLVLNALETPGPDPASESGDAPPERPFRAASLHSANLSFAQHGTRRLLPASASGGHGGCVWQLAVRCAGCIWLSSRIVGAWTDPAARVFALADAGAGANRPYVSPATTAADGADALDALVTPPLPGGVLVLEYFSPDGAPPPPTLTLHSLTAGVGGIFAATGPGAATVRTPSPTPRRSRALDSSPAVAAAAIALHRARGRSAPCHADAACARSRAVADAARGLLLLLIGGEICTASLLNTAGAAGGEARAPLVLTAYHCVRDAAALAKSPAKTVGAPPVRMDATFVFNWRAERCGETDAAWLAGGLQTLHGATLVAHSANSDLALLRLSSPVPTAYRARLLGWDAAPKPPNATVVLHHPRGDLAKFARDAQPPTAARYCDACCDDPHKSAAGGAASAASAAQCWRGIHWRVGAYEEGATALGSSGAPLLDAASARVVGALHGGYATCEAPRGDFYGALSGMYNDEDAGDEYAGHGGRSTRADHGDGAEDGRRARQQQRLRALLDPAGTGALWADGAEASAPAAAAQAAGCAPSVRVASVHAHAPLRELRLRASSVDAEVLIALSLACAPSAPVSVRLIVRWSHGNAAHSSGQLASTAPGELSLAPANCSANCSANVQFDVDDWAEPRLVAARALHGGDGEAHGLLWLHVASADPSYAALAPPPIAVHVAGETAAEIAALVTEGSGGMGGARAGGADDSPARLSAAPLRSGGLLLVVLIVVVVRLAVAQGAVAEPASFVPRSRSSRGLGPGRGARELGAGTTDYGAAGPSDGSRAPPLL